MRRGASACQAGNRDRRRSRRKQDDTLSRSSGSSAAGQAPAEQPAADPMALLEATASRPTPAISACAAAEAQPATCTAVVERIALPALSGRQAAPESPSLSLSPAPRRPTPGQAARSEKVALASDEDCEEGDDLANLTPLERYLLRSGEIMESYILESKALGRRGEQRAQR